MKNYLMIILATIITGIMLNNGSIVKADVSTAVDTDFSDTISVLDSYKEAENIEIATSVNTTSVNVVSTDITPVKTAKTTVSTTPTTSANTSADASASNHINAPINTYNYTVTKSITDLNSHKNPNNDIISYGKLVYAHNTNNLLGTIRNLTKNDTFTLTKNGVTKTYQVVKSETFYKENDTTLKLCSNNDQSDCNGGVYNMNNLAYANRFMGTHYDVALFTCTGRTLGDGDATHRKVVFAVEL